MSKRRLLCAIWLVLVCGLPTASASPSANFRQRIDEFWTAFSMRESHYRKAIAAGKAITIAAELRDLFGRLLEGASWELVPGSTPDRTGVVLSAASNMPYRMLIEFWVDAAPEDLPWDVLSAKPAIPNAAKRPKLNMGARQYAAKDILFVARVDPPARKVHLSIYHPDFAEADEEERGTVAFVWLDWLLGERVVEGRVGAIDFATEKPAKSDGTFADLPAWMAAQTKIWGAVEDPLARRLRYGDSNANKAPSKGLRADIAFGETMIKETVERAGEDPLKDTGAVFGTVVFSEFAGDSAMVTMKALRALESSLSKALLDKGVGQATGCAIATSRAYVDVLLVDAPAALTLLRRSLANDTLGARAVTWHTLWGDDSEVLFPIQKQKQKEK